MDRMGKWLRAVLLLCVFGALPNCGGGGGGGGVSSPPFEMAYVLEEKNSDFSGQIEYFPMNPGNGSFYPETGAAPVPTGGSVPISLLADPSNTNFLYALNNNNTTIDGSTAGSVSGFSAAGYQKNMSPVSTRVSTGPDPVSMAIDPGGRYLAVADHGNGKTNGDVSLFTISSGTVAPSGTWTSSQTCGNPYRVLFAPGASGSASDTVIVACSSPEIWGNTSNPGVAVYACTIANISSSSVCKNVLFTSSFNQSINSRYFALVNFLFVPGTSTAVGPVLSGTTSGSSPTAYLLVCDFSNNSCSTHLSTIDNTSGFLPSGNVAFSGSGSSARLYVGNYYPSSSGFIPDYSEFSSCSSSTSSWTCHSPLKVNSSSTPGPIYFYATGSTLYIAATQTPIKGSYTTTGNTSGGSSSSSGTIYACALSNISSSSASCSSQTTGGWPVAITVDPQTGNYLFVPTLSGTVDLYSGASTGNLSRLTGPAVASGYLPLSVLVLP